MPKSLVDELDRKGGNPFVPGLGRALREWRPDVIHCHAMARIAELCLRTARHLSTNDSRLTTKAIISLHGGGANVPGEEAKSLMAPTRGRLPWGKAIDIAMGWTRRVPEDFDGIVCVGEDEYEKYRARHPHVLFLPNGVDTKLFEGVESARQARLPRLSSSSSPSSPSSALSLLCVARIDRQKNQMALVEAVARHPGMSLRLVGPVTQTDYDEELKRRVAELGVADRVAFVGALKPGSPELVAEYARADVFVLPSRHEPFGIVVLEAWAAGLPVVASDVGGLGRLCAAHPGAAVTFPPGDAAAMDAAVEEVRGRLRSGAKAIREAARSAAGQYDWSVLAGRLVDFFGQI
jgi:glycosyltransferase involved in cell wall biosynthesis